MEQYFITIYSGGNKIYNEIEDYVRLSYSGVDKLHITNLITCYRIKELYSTKTLHIHGSHYFYYSKIQNIRFYNLQKLKANFVVYGECFDMFHNSEFKGDISNWNTSSVTDMKHMFCKTKFLGDISKWDVSSVTNMHGMFQRSKFNGDLSKWVTSNVMNMAWMFCNSKFTGDISTWDVSSVTDMHDMFHGNKSKRDISNWDTSSVTDMGDMFHKSRMKIPDWYHKYVNEN